MRSRGGKWWGREWQIITASRRRRSRRKREHEPRKKAEKAKRLKEPLRIDPYLGSEHGVGRVAEPRKRKKGRKDVGARAAARDQSLKNPVQRRLVT